MYRGLKEQKIAALEGLLEEQDECVGAAPPPCLADDVVHLGGGRGGGVEVLRDPAPPRFLCEPNPTSNSSPPPLPNPSPNPSQTTSNPTLADTSWR